MTTYSQAHTDGVDVTDCNAFSFEVHLLFQLSPYLKYISQSFTPTPSPPRPQLSHMCYNLRGIPSSQSHMCQPRRNRVHITAHHTGVNLYQAVTMANSHTNCVNLYQAGTGCTTANLTYLEEQQSFEAEWPQAYLQIVCIIVHLFPQTIPPIEINKSPHVITH